MAVNQLFDQNQQSEIENSYTDAFAEDSLLSIMKFYNLRLFNSKGYSLDAYYPVEVDYVPTYNVFFPNVSTDLYESLQFFLLEERELPDGKKEVLYPSLPHKVDRLENLDPIDVDVFQEKVFISNDEELPPGELYYDSMRLVAEWVDKVDESTIFMYRANYNEILQEKNILGDNESYPSIEILDTSKLEISSNNPNWRDQSFHIGKKEDDESKRNYPIQFNFGITSATPGTFNRKIIIYLIKEYTYSVEDRKTGFVETGKRIKKVPLFVLNLWGEIKSEEERFKIVLENFGKKLNEEDLYVFRESDIDEEYTDYILLNQKRKELLITGDEIYNYIGSYKGLYNALNFFGYYDLKVREYFLNTKHRPDDPSYMSSIEIYDPNVDMESREYKDMKDREKKLFTNPDFIKTHFIGLYYPINKETGDFDEFGLPVVEPAFTFTNEEIIIKLFGLKKILEERFLPHQVRIFDITGEGIYFSRIGTKNWLDTTVIIKNPIETEEDFAVYPSSEFIANLKRFHSEFLYYLGYKIDKKKIEAILDPIHTLYLTNGNFDEVPVITGQVPNRLPLKFDDVLIKLNGERLFTKYTSRVRVNNLQNTESKLLQVNESGELELYSISSDDNIELLEYLRDEVYDDRLYRVYYYGNSIFTSRVTNDNTIQAKTSINFETPRTLLRWKLSVSMFSQNQGNVRILTSNNGNNYIINVTDEEKLISTLTQDTGIEALYISDEEGSYKLTIQDNRTLNIEKISNTIDYTSELYFYSNTSVIQWTVVVRTIDTVHHLETIRYNDAYKLQNEAKFNIQIIDSIYWNWVLGSENGNKYKLYFDVNSNDFSAVLTNEPQSRIPRVLDSTTDITYDITVNNNGIVTLVKSKEFLPAINTSIILYEISKRSIVKFKYNNGNKNFEYSLLSNACTFILEGPDGQHWKLISAEDGSIITEKTTLPLTRKLYIKDASSATHEIYISNNLGSLYTELSSISTVQESFVLRSNEGKVFTYTVKANNGSIINNGTVADTCTFSFDPTLLYNKLWIKDFSKEIEILDSNSSSVIYRLPAELHSTEGDRRLELWSPLLDISYWTVVTTDFSNRIHTDRIEYSRKSNDDNFRFNFIGKNYTKGTYDVIDDTTALLESDSAGYYKNIHFIDKVYNPYYLPRIIKFSNSSLFKDTLNSILKQSSRNFYQRYEEPTDDFGYYAEVFRVLVDQFNIKLDGITQHDILVAFNEVLSFMRKTLLKGEDDFSYNKWVGLPIILKYVRDNIEWDDLRLSWEDMSDKSLGLHLDESNQQTTYFIKQSIDGKKWIIYIDTRGIIKVERSELPISDESLIVREGNISKEVLISNTGEVYLEDTQKLPITNFTVFFNKENGTSYKVELINLVLKVGIIQYPCDYYFSLNVSNNFKMKLSNIKGNIMTLPTDNLGIDALYLRSENSTVWKLYIYDDQGHYRVDLAVDQTLDIPQRYFYLSYEDIQRFEFEISNEGVVQLNGESSIECYTDNSSGGLTFDNIDTNKYTLGRWLVKYSTTNNNGKSWSYDTGPMSIKNFQEYVVFVPYTGVYDVLMMLYTRDGHIKYKRRKSIVDVRKYPVDFFAIGMAIDDVSTWDQDIEIGLCDFDWDSNRPIIETSYEDSRLNWLQMEPIYYIDQNYIYKNDTINTYEVEDFSYEENAIIIRGREFFDDQVKSKDIISDNELSVDLDIDNRLKKYIQPTLLKENALVSDYFNYTINNYIETNNDPEEYVFYTTSIEYNFNDSSNFLPGKEYSWKVRGLDISGKPLLWSKDSNFIIPIIGNSVYHQYGESYEQLGSSILLEWINDSNSHLYQIELSTDRNFINHKQVLWSSTPNILLENILTDFNIYCRIGSLNKNGELYTWSERFTILANNSTSITQVVISTWQEEAEYLSTTITNICNDPRWTDIVVIDSNNDTIYNESFIQNSSNDIEIFNIFEQPCTIITTILESSGNKVRFEYNYTPSIIRDTIVVPVPVINSFINWNTYYTIIDVYLPSVLENQRMRVVLKNNLQEVVYTHINDTYNSNNQYFYVPKFSLNNYTTLTAEITIYSNKNKSTTTVLRNVSIPKFNSSSVSITRTVENINSTTNFILDFTDGINIYALFKYKKLWNFSTIVLSKISTYVPIYCGLLDNVNYSYYNTRLELKLLSMYDVKKELNSSVTSSTISTNSLVLLEPFKNSSNLTYIIENPRYSLNPLEESTIVTIPIKFSWQWDSSIDIPTHYQIEIYEESTDNKVYSDIINKTDLSITINDILLKEDKVYLWRVKAKFINNNWSSWTSAQEFSLTTKVSTHELPILSVEGNSITIYDYQNFNFGENDYFITESVVDNNYKIGISKLLSKEYLDDSSIKVTFDTPLFIRYIDDTIYVLKHVVGENNTTLSRISYTDITTKYPSYNSGKIDPEIITFRWDPVADLNYLYEATTYELRITSSDKIINKNELDVRGKYLSDKHEILFKEEVTSRRGDTLFIEKIQEYTLNYTGRTIPTIRENITYVLPCSVGPQKVWNLSVDAGGSITTKRVKQNDYRLAIESENDKKVWELFSDSRSRLITYSGNGSNPRWSTHIKSNKKKELYASKIEVDDNGNIQFSKELFASESLVNKKVEILYTRDNTFGLFQIHEGGSILIEKFENSQSLLDVMNTAYIKDGNNTVYELSTNNYTTVKTDPYYSIDSSLVDEIIQIKEKVYSVYTLPTAFNTINAGRLYKVISTNIFYEYTGNTSSPWTQGFERYWNISILTNGVITYSKAFTPSTTYVEYLQVKYNSKYEIYNKENLLRSTQRTSESTQFLVLKSKSGLSTWAFYTDTIGQVKTYKLTNSTVIKNKVYFKPTDTFFFDRWKIEIDDDGALWTTPVYDNEVIINTNEFRVPRENYTSYESISIDKQGSLRTSDSTIEEPPPPLYIRSISRKTVWVITTKEDRSIFTSLASDIGIGIPTELYILSSKKSDRLILKSPKKSLFYSIGTPNGINLETKKIKAEQEYKKYLILLQENTTSIFWKLTVTKNDVISTQKLDEVYDVWNQPVIRYKSKNYRLVINDTGYTELKETTIPADKGIYIQGEPDFTNWEIGITDDGTVFTEKTDDLALCECLLVDHINKEGAFVLTIDYTGHVNINPYLQSTIIENGNILTYQEKDTVGKLWDMNVYWDGSLITSHNDVSLSSFSPIFKTVGKNIYWNIYVNEDGSAVTVPATNEINSAFYLFNNTLTTYGTNSFSNIRIGDYVEFYVSDISTSLKVEYVSIDQTSIPTITYIEFSDESEFIYRNRFFIDKVLFNYDTYTLRSTGIKNDYIWVENEEFSINPFDYSIELNSNLEKYFKVDQILHFYISPTQKKDLLNRSDLDYENYYKIIRKEVNTSTNVMKLYVDDSLRLSENAFNYNNLQKIALPDINGIDYWQTSIDKEGSVTYNKLKRRPTRINTRWYMFSNDNTRIYQLQIDSSTIPEIVSVEKRSNEDQYFNNSIFLERRQEERVWSFSLEQLLNSGNPITVVDDNIPENHREVNSLDVVVSDNSQLLLYKVVATEISFNDTVYQDYLLFNHTFENFLWKLHIDGTTDEREGTLFSTIRVERVLRVEYMNQVIKDNYIVIISNNYYNVTINENGRLVFTVTQSRVNIHQFNFRSFCKQKFYRFAIPSAIQNNLPVQFIPLILDNGYSNPYEVSKDISMYAQINESELVLNLRKNFTTRYRQGLYLYNLLTDVLPLSDVKNYTVRLNYVYGRKYLAIDKVELIATSSTLERTTYNEQSSKVYIKPGVAIDHITTEFKGWWTQYSLNKSYNQSNLRNINWTNDSLWSEHHSWQTLDWKPQTNNGFEVQVFNGSGKFIVNETEVTINRNLGESLYELQSIMSENNESSKYTEKFLKNYYDKNSESFKELLKSYHLWYRDSNNNPITRLFFYEPYGKDELYISSDDALEIRRNLEQITEFIIFDTSVRGGFYFNDKNSIDTFIFKKTRNSKDWEVAIKELQNAATPLLNRFDYSYYVLDDTTIGIKATLKIPVHIEYNEPALLNGTVINNSTGKFTVFTYNEGGKFSINGKIFRISKDLNNDPVKILFELKTTTIDEFKRFNWSIEKDHEGHRGNIVGTLKDLSEFNELLYSSGVYYINYVGLCYGIESRQVYNLPTKKKVNSSVSIPFMEKSLPYPNRLPEYHDNYESASKNIDLQISSTTAGATITWEDFFITRNRLQVNSLTPVIFTYDLSKLSYSIKEFKWELYNDEGKLLMVSKKEYSSWVFDTPGFYGMKLTVVDEENDTLTNNKPRLLEVVY